VLAGPNIASEVVAGYAAAATIAMPDQNSAHKLAELFRTERFRIYSTTDVLGVEVAGALKNVFGTKLFRVYQNDDVIGCEVAGALKNVMAIAAGMADGLGTGDNTRAAVITRGLAEMTRLGVAMGGDPMTFAGMAGMGDLVATCISPQSRNRSVGEQIGQGKTLDEVIAAMNQVAEGVKSCRTVLELADEHGVEMPIVSEVVGVVHEGRTAEDAYRGLLRREVTLEHHT
jgi:glycerol-3-phosphate dehydrogenase (NAD(P)+)